MDRMSIDSLIGKYMGSRISTDSLLGQYLGFSTVRISFILAGFTPYLLFALTSHIPVAEDKPHYFIRHRSPHRLKIFTSPGNIFHGGIN